jgi:hypothetical protein
MIIKKYFFLKNDFFFFSHQKRKMDSFNTKFTNLIQSLLVSISTKYNIELSELEALYNGKSPQSSVKSTPTSGSIAKKVQPSAPSAPSAPETDLSKMTGAQLKEECKKRGLKVSGTKAELIARIGGGGTPPSGTGGAPSKGWTKPEKNSDGLRVEKGTNFVFSDDADSPKLVVGKLFKGVVIPLSKSDMDICIKHSYKYTPPIAQKITESVKSVESVANKYGNISITLDGVEFVIDNSKIIIGTQSETEDIYALDSNDISIINKYGLTYETPINLDTNETMDVTNLIQNEIDEEEEEEEELEELTILE